MSEESEESKKFHGPCLFRPMVEELRSKLALHESKCEEHGLLGRDCYSCVPVALPHPAIKEALAWAEGKTMSAKSDYVEVHAMVLAAALRSCEADLAAFQSHDRCNAGFRSRIKTLEEENARMRAYMENIQKVAEKYQFDTGAVARGAVQVIRGIADVALKQEAE